MKPAAKYATAALAPLIAAVFGGCALLKAGPDYQPPELHVPAQWSAAASATATPPQSEARLARWWTQFADATLEALIEQALAGNLDLKLAQARLRQARANRLTAESGLFPTLSAATGASRSKAAGAIGNQTPHTFYDAGFDATWEIDLFGGKQRGIEAAAADLAASQASLDGARVSLVAEVARNYVELRSYQRRIAVARDNLASQSETLQITEWRHQAGLARASEVDQARTAREQTRAGIPDLEVAQTAAANRIAVLLGRNPGELRDRLATVAALPALPASVASGIPAQILQQRPDLIAAERTLAAETARVGQKLAQRFPSLTLSGSFGWQAYSFSALGGAGTVTRAIAGSLAATLFDGGRLRSLVEVQSAIQEQALVSYRSSVLGALEEVENALTAYAAARERVDARRAAAESARRAADLTRQLYQSGLVDFQQVLETQRTQLAAEDSLATADATLRTGLIALYKALGGGWEISGNEKKS